MSEAPRSSHPDGSDALGQAGEALAALDERAVEEHPETLEAVHRAVVSELDALAGVGAAAPPDS